MYFNNNILACLQKYDKKLRRSHENLRKKFYPTLKLLLRINNEYRDKTYEVHLKY